MGLPESTIDKTATCANVHGPPPPRFEPANGKTKAIFEDFTFIGDSAFHKVAGELHYDVVGSDLYASADFNGDTKADFMIHFIGITSLTAQDFIL